MKLSQLSLFIFSSTSLVLAQQETPQDFCKRTAGPAYVPRFDAQGEFTGYCDVAPINVCLGTEYISAMAGTMGCCLPPNVVSDDDKGLGKKGCCGSGQKVRFDPTVPSISCINPPPPPPPISCPGSAGQIITRNGVRLQVFCNRFVREWVPVWDAIGKLAMLGSGGTVMNDNFEMCADKCSRDPKCNGANFWIDIKQCAISNLPPGNAFKRGSWYELPPPMSWGKPVISIVAVPKRY